MMLLNSLFETNSEKENERKIKLSSEAVEKLLEKKEIIKCKDGVAQIDKSHPSYDFWMKE